MKKPKQKLFQKQKQNQKVIVNINTEKPRKYTRKPKDKPKDKPHQPHPQIYYNATAPMPINPVPSQQTAFANAVQETVRQVELPNGIERPQQKEPDVYTPTPAIPPSNALQAPINILPNATHPFSAHIGQSIPQSATSTQPAINIVLQPTPPATSILTQPSQTRGFLADISTGAGHLRPIAPTAPAPAPSTSPVFTELLAAHLRPTPRTEPTVITPLNLTPSLLEAKRTGLRTPKPREPTETSNQAEQSFTQTKSRLKPPVMTPTVAPIPIIHLPTQQEIFNVQHQRTVLETPVDNRLILVSTNNREIPNETQNTVAREQERNKELIARRAETKLIQHIAPQILGGIYVKPEMLRQLRINALEPAIHPPIHPPIHPSIHPIEQRIPEHQAKHDEEKAKFVKKIKVIKNHTTHKTIHDLAKEHGFKSSHRGKPNRQELYDFLARDFDMNPQNYY